VQDPAKILQKHFAETGDITKASCCFESRCEHHTVHHRRAVASLCFKRVVGVSAFTSPVTTLVH
jgi:GTP cyclohydrolase I